MELSEKCGHFVQYRHREKVKKEVYNVTKEYRSLDAKLESFVFPGGRSLNLINLHGTIPVKFKNNTYHIPICIWLMDSHPDNPPVCYVKPTPNMTISVSHHVDYCGKIYAPYLHDWSPTNSDVLTLIGVLIHLFSENPPLYSRPANAAPTSTSTPYPINPGYYPRMPTPSYNIGPTPPYPTSTSGANNALPYPVGQTTPYPVQSDSSYAARPSMQSSYPPYPTSAQSMPQPITNSGTITEQHIHASLLSAAEDKVRRLLREYLAQAKAELDTLDRIQVELVQGKERLAHLMAKLEAEQNDWEKMLTTLRDKELELDTALLNINKQGELDVDEAVITTAPLYRQLLNAFAEEAATEDAIYYLGEGLRRGVIDLDVFLKHVRSLSRKQFMLRALMHKCRNKAGLAS